LRSRNRNFYHEFEDPGKMRRSKATLTISQDCDGDEEIGPRGVRRDFHSADQRRGRDPKEQKDCITPGGSYETVGARLEIRSDLFSLNQQRLFKSAEEFGTEIRNTRRPRLFDDRSRVQDMKNRPMFFPTNPVWFRRSSYSDPLAGDARWLAPLVEWSDPPGGRPGVDGKRVPQPQQSRSQSQKPPDAWCETRQSKGRTQQEGSPHSSDEIDLQNVIDGPRHKKKFPT
jgi:hypothetical protein